MTIQEFATPQDALAHYGKKGMKWGVRNKPTGAQITDARLRVANKDIKYLQDRRKIKNQDVSRSTKKAQLKDLRVKALANPDRLTAARMTRGEKAILGVLAVGVPGAGTVAVASVVAQRAQYKREVRKAIEKTS